MSVTFPVLGVFLGYKFANFATQPLQLVKYINFFVSVYVYHSQCSSLLRTGQNYGLLGQFRKKFSDLKSSIKFPNQNISTAPNFVQRLPYTSLANQIFIAKENHSCFVRPTKLTFEENIFIQKETFYVIAPDIY